uniref:Uncharacterized protein n=1 Tax=Rhizophora mucronata TaxID=61149 RepID=A0A2P2P786_RHIMU
MIPCLTPPMPSLQ